MIKSILFILCIAYCLATAIMMVWFLSSPDKDSTDHKNEDWNG